MMLCQIQAINDGHDVIDYFQKWLNTGYMTPNNNVFDYGLTVKNALDLQLENKPIPDNEYTNGNGSLMRVLPLAFNLLTKPYEIFDVVKESSSITHPHIRSVLACFYYVYLCRNILILNSYGDAISLTNGIVLTKIKREYPEELIHFKRILNHNELTDLNSIKSSSYVIDTLEAVIYCITSSNSYSESVLKAVNLGDDTDTIAALVGGVAPLIFGEVNSKWDNLLANRPLFEPIIDKL